MLKGDDRQPQQESGDGESLCTTPGTQSTEAQLDARFTRSQTKTSGTELDLSCLGLTAFPVEALTPGRFPKLRKLNLRRNCLTRLPDALGSCFPHLTTLDVSDNQLEELPETLGSSLLRLQRLNTANNKLRTLPDTLARLDQLEELILRNNQLEAIGEKLSALPRLQLVDLSGNDTLEDAPERLRRLHERNLLLHSRTKRRELISRALRVRAAVTQTLLVTNAGIGSPSVAAATRGLKSNAKRNTVI